MEQHRPDHITLTSAELQDLWFAQSLAAGWVFASDWHDPADRRPVRSLRPRREPVARSRTTRVQRAPMPASRWARRWPTSTDLTAVLPGLPTDVLHRAVSLGWADRMMAPATDGVRSADRAGLARLPPDPDGRGLPRGRSRRHEGLRRRTPWSSSGSTSTGRDGLGPDDPADPVRRCHAHRVRRRANPGPARRPHGGRADRARGRCSPAGRNCSPAWSPNGCPRRHTSSTEPAGLDRATAGFSCPRPST